MTDRQTQTWTVLRLLEWTTDFFRQRGSDAPRLEAEILLAHARGCERIALYTAFDQVPDDEQLTAFREMVRRRGEGAPVAYLVGYREFYSLRLRVSEDVLIPRPETEHVVIEALDAAKSMRTDAASEPPLAIADVGTGSGAIAIALAKHLDNIQVFAVDSSEAALEIAAYNVRQHELQSTVELGKSDLLDSFEPNTRFDIICSNPPYVSEAEYAELPSNVRDHEPREALVAGPNGTEVIEQLLRVAPQRLREGGRMIVELSPMIAEQCLAFAAAQKALSGARLVKDLAGQQRLLIVDKA